MREQVANLTAQAADLARVEVETAPQRLCLGVAVGFLEPPQQAATLGAGGLEAVRRGGKLTRYVLAGLGTRAHFAQLRQVAQCRPEVASGDAQIEIAFVAVLAGRQRGAQHESPVAIGHADHSVCHTAQAICGRDQCERRRALDAAVAFAGGKGAPGG